jgi:hypothetical protein
MADRAASARAARVLGAFAILGVGAVHIVEYSADGRFAEPVLSLLAAGGILLAAGSLAGLLLSETTGLFGFIEQGYRSAIVLSIALELAAIGLLGAYLAATRVELRLHPR